MDLMDQKRCNCAECEVTLTGTSPEMLAWYATLTDHQKSKLPKLVAGRINKRPYCADCLRLNTRTPKVDVTGKSRVLRGPRDDSNPLQDRLIRSWEDEG